MAGGVGVETAEFAAALREPGRNAADERSAVLGFFRLRGQDRKVDVVDLAEAVRDEPHAVVIVFGDDGEDVQVDRRGHDDAVVVVGVVAADLGAAGGAVQADLAPGAEVALKAFDGLQVARALGRDLRGRVKFGQGGVISARLDLLFELRCCCHSGRCLRDGRAALVTMHKKRLHFWRFPCRTLHL